MAPDSQTPTTDPAAESVAPARSRLWSRLSGDPLLTIFGTLAVGLLIFTLTRADNRISRLEDAVNAGFAAVDARFTDQDAKIDALDTKIDALEPNLTAKINELDLKLTALIAALNATDEIEAALEGRLRDPATAADPR